MNLIKRHYKLWKSKYLYRNYRGLISLVIPSFFIIFGYLSETAYGQGFFTQYLDNAPGTPATTVTYFLTGLTRLACYVIRFGIIAVGVMIIVYGLMFLFSRGNSQGWDRAKRALGWGVVGGLIIFGVFTIILTTIDLVGYGSSYPYTGNSIFIINCQ